MLRDSTFRHLKLLTDADLIKMSESFLKVTAHELCCALNVNSCTEFYASHTATKDLLAHPFCPVWLATVARVHNGNATTHVHRQHISSAISLLHATAA